ncbi:MAG: hypothetical protein GY839_09565, partial [candidate division Zixibacteria bacterium]|nr:hypothetical protein [candidate division Zixibacteria bacterium]
MKRMLLPLSLLLMTILVLGLTQNGFAGEISQVNSAVVRLQTNHPGAHLYTEDQHITRVYGQSFGSGSTPEATAERFCVEYADVFGVRFSDLRPVSILAEGRHTQQVMYRPETGDYKFTLVYYSQFADDIPVYNSDLRLLVSNKAGNPLVLASSSLRDLEDFSVPMGAGINSNLAENSIIAFDSDLRAISTPRLVIWAGINNMVVEPRVSMEIDADNGLSATPEYRKWRLLIDAATGEILHSENMIINVDVNGGVDGMATWGWKADICNSEAITPMPWSRVYVSGGNTAYADQNGNFTIPNGGSSPVTVYSHVRGQRFRVYNEAGSDGELYQTVTPPGPANFIHNAANTDEYERAEVNAYVHANMVRDLVVEHNPTYPTVWNETEFTVNVNLSSTCNAYYDYESINFYRSGGGCSNTAFSTIVHHEYGHHLVSTGGSGQGQYGEGMGDVMGILIADEAELAWGFYNDCYEYMRTGDNTYQYPCSGEIHDCGQLISGCVWDTRNALAITNPITYQDILSNLAINSILMHSGTEITPTITIDYLTLDDDDGNINNGTPHYAEICAGFNPHNMDCPDLELLGFNYPDGLPEFMDPAGGSIRVEVYAVSGTPQSGTGILHYNIGSGWVSNSMTVVSPNVYDAVFPAIECGTDVQFYVSAQTTAGYTVNDPSGAPATTYSFTTAIDLNIVFEDNFETNQGWTAENLGATSGDWQRGIPVNDSGWDYDPYSDGDGS